MKSALLLTPAVLSLLVLAAHFLRHGQLGLLVVTLAFVGLLALRRAWVARLVQVTLVLGTIEWGWTLYTLHAARQAMGIPTTRMSLILGAVAAITLISAVLFQLGPLKRRYRLASASRKTEVF